MNSNRFHGTGTRLQRLLLAWVAAAVCLVPLRGEGGRTSHFKNREGFAYYHIWWREARADHGTALLLHCGPPREHAWTRTGNARLEKENPPEEDPLVEGGIDDLFSEAPSTGALGGLMGDVRAQQEKELKQRDGRNRDEKAPEGKLYDYSPNLGVLDLPEGVRRVPDGKFGKGLEFTGKQGLYVTLGNAGGRRTIDGWFKPAALPEKSTCLIGSRAGAQLRLLPDGRLRASWYAKRQATERTHITSESAVSAGEWSHIACYLWVSGGRFPKPEFRLAVNGRVVARHKGKGHSFSYPLLVAENGGLHIGADADGSAVYTGLMDDIRVASRRRYCIREDWPQFDPVDHPRPVPFGPPCFEKDVRVFHIGFESPALTVHPEGAIELEWDLGGYASFEDYQVDAPFGKAVLVDPAMGFPRIPIEGLPLHEGTFELWFQPVNWDNNTAFGEGMSWAGKYMSIVRFFGRDRRNGKTVVFMEADLPRASMFCGKGWLQPGTWSHFAWSWSREDVLKENGWGDAKKGDPAGAFRAMRFGELQWRAMLKRNVDVLDHVEPLYLEIGIPEDYLVYHGQRPAIIIDEIIYHSIKAPSERIKQVTAEWRDKYHPEAKAE
ncbi:MAG: LamG domain-containing protein [Kiritimatiellia bacterium]